jgi:predicted metal-dependent HD superfamily phosphohydrolase
MSLTSLEDWTRLWHSLGMIAPVASRDELIQRYSESHRAYHTMQHLEECLVTLNCLDTDTPTKSLIALAIWFHDAVYDTHSSDNERQSAILADDALRSAGASPELRSAIDRLIMATAHTTVPTQPDERLIVDIDLKIFSAPTARFAEYNRQIRQEYAWVPEDIYQKRRAEVLRGFLNRERIYLSPSFQRYETAARSNLENAIATL